MLQISRRKLLGGLSAFIAAPAIIKVAGIMPVKVWREPGYAYYNGVGMITLDRGSASPAVSDSIVAYALEDIPAGESGWLRLANISGYDPIEIGPDDRVTNRA